MSTVPLLLRKTASLSPVLLVFVKNWVEDHPLRIHVAVCCCCAWGRCRAGAGVYVSIRGETRSMSVAATILERFDR